MRTAFMVAFASLLEVMFLLLVVVPLSQSYRIIFSERTVTVRHGNNRRCKSRRQNDSRFGKSSPIVLCSSHLLPTMRPLGHPSAVALVNDLADFMNAQAFHVWFARHIVFLDQD